MVFEPGQKLKRLEAVDAELLEEVVVGRDFAPRYIEMPGRKVEYFVRSLFYGSHPVLLQFIKQSGYLES
jgi:hypothetical protein